MSIISKFFKESEVVHIHIEGTGTYIYSFAPELHYLTSL